MGLFLKFINNTRKPSGILGKIMIVCMNKGHTKMADWGMKHFPQNSFHKLLDIGCGGGRNAFTLLKKYDYPPEEMKSALEKVIAQCELWADVTI